MADALLQTFPLGTQWPTIDPFLFCAHHRDDYPEGTEGLGPDAPLVGRDIGMDFAGVDGWNMYHGATVPGFRNIPTAGSRPSPTCAPGSATIATHSERRPASAAATRSG
jgi:hypothetical protein